MLKDLHLRFQFSVKIHKVLSFFIPPLRTEVPAHFICTPTNFHFLEVFADYNMLIISPTVKTLFFLIYTRLRRYNKEFCMTVHVLCDLR